MPSLPPAPAAGPGDMSRAAADVRRCSWCKEPLPGRRKDARTCSKACRQASHRFGRAVAEGLPRGTRQVAAVRALARALQPRRFAYADPPYPGLALRYYCSDEVDHVALVARLRDEFPDGWALSTSAAALRSVLALCPPTTRVCVWNRGVRHVRAARRPLCAWEPVLLSGGRRLEPGSDPVCDLLTLSIAARARSHPGALVGMKPAAFVCWLWRLLGAQPGDELADLYPGSDAVSRAWSLLSRGDGDVATDTSRGPGAAAGDPSSLQAPSMRDEKAC